MTAAAVSPFGSPEPLQTVELVFPLVAASAKNRTQIRRPKGGGKPWIAKSDKAEKHQDAMRLLAQSQLRRALRVGRTLFGRNYFAAEITVDGERGRMRVRLHDLGPQPARGRCLTRRDVHGVVESVMDALQGVVFDDDRQARRVSVEWGAVEG